MQRSTMSKPIQPDPKKALKFEAKGDKLVAKQKFRQAIEAYQKSESFNQDRAEIYEKLVDTLNRFEHEWNEEDFSKSMTWTMRHQEILNPQMKLVHETFSFEYKEVQKLIQRLMLAMGPELENQIIDEILSHGQQGILPMLHFLLSIKAVANPQPADTNGPSDAFTPPTERS